MSKYKALIPGILGGKKDTNINEDKLETDALPVYNDQSAVENISNTPTASADLTESLVRELADPNYNSMTAVDSMQLGQGGGGGGALVQNGNMDANLVSNSNTTNTMNVHNAQQQMVMNFSNSSNLHFGSVYNFNQNLNAGHPPPRRSSSNNSDGSICAAATVKGGNAKYQKPQKTKTIVAMMQSMEEPNHRLLDTVATHLGEGWKEVMRELGHSEGQIEQAIIDHQMHGNIKEVIYQLLLQWIRGADDGVATLGRLTTLLWETNHRECVQRMKLVCKAQEKRKVSN